MEPRCVFIVELNTQINKQKDKILKISQNQPNINNFDISLSEIHSTKLRYG